MEALTAGRPIRGKFPRIAPPTRGVSMTVQYGNGWRVRWARIIFVVIRPKTKDRVTQNRTRWFSSIRVEYGEKSHKALATVNTTIGVHSKNTGRIGRLSFRRALITWRTQNGMCAPRSEMTRIGTHRSLTE